MSPGGRVGRCMVCGRYFHEGQGIVIPYQGLTLEFHSARCASRFLRRLLEEIDPSCGRPAVARLVDEYRESLRELDRKASKRI